MTKNPPTVSGATPQLSSSMEKSWSLMLTAELIIKPPLIQTGLNRLCGL